MGWSIIALTVLVRALLMPLAFKQMHSVQKLQRAQHVAHEVLKVSMAKIELFFLETLSCEKLRELTQLSGGGAQRNR